MPVIMLMIVDFPLPEGPTIATISPAAMDRSTPRNAGYSNLPLRYTFSTPASSIKVAVAVLDPGVSVRCVVTGHFLESWTCGCRRDPRPTSSRAHPPTPTKTVRTSPWAGPGRSNDRLAVRHARRALSTAVGKASVPSAPPAHLRVAPEQGCEPRPQSLLRPPKPHRSSLSPLAATGGCKASRGGVRGAPKRLQRRCRPSRPGLRPAPVARP